MKRGIDISHYQKITDWSKLSSQDFIICKCTESINYLDPTYNTNKKEIRKFGKIFGAYHFGRGGNVIKEADWFLKNVGAIAVDDILVLDWEIENPNPTKWCKDWLDYVKGKTGITPYLYTNEARANKIDNSYPWWIARYSVKEPTKPWDIWQYTSSGNVAGILGRVDQNFMHDAPVASNLPPSGVFIQYSQNDPLWKFDHLGGSNLTLGDYGCVTSATCTLASWFGERMTPKMLASYKELYTKGGLIIWKQLENILKTLKFHYRYYSFNEKIIDDALKDSNTCVLLNISGGKHWVAGLNKTITGYKVSDPYPYPASTKVVKKSEIVGFCVLIRK